MSNPRIPPKNVRVTQNGNKFRVIVRDPGQLPPFVPSAEPIATTVPKTTATSATSAAAPTVAATSAAAPVAAPTVAPTASVNRETKVAGIAARRAAQMESNAARRAEAPATAASTNTTKAAASVPAASSINIPEWAKIEAQARKQFDIARTEYPKERGQHTTNEYLAKLKEGYIEQRNSSRGLTMLNPDGNVTGNAIEGALDSVRNGTSFKMHGGKRSTYKRSTYKRRTYKHRNNKKRTTQKRMKRRSRKH